MSSLLSVVLVLYGWISGIHCVPVCRCYLLLGAVILKENSVSLNLFNSIYNATVCHSIVTPLH